MSENHADLVKERLELQRALQEHFSKDGFNYREYVSPPTGSWIEHYRHRLKEIDAVLAPELQYWKG